jgi:hypothetical protein
MGQMSNFIHNLQRWVERKFTPEREKPRVEVIQQYTVKSTGSRRGSRSTVVKRTPRPYWEEHGWKRERQTYQGMFQTRFGSWSGYVTKSPGGRVEVFIHNPPTVLERHPHWPCFNKRKDGWYFVHPIRPIADVSAGIINMEKTITEAYEN